MPTYRRAHLVGETIRSVLLQSFADFELLVRDDGKGDDGTEESVKKAAQGDPRVKYHRNEKNLRMPGNLNGGIEDSRGEYIAVCHDHDIYHPDFLFEYVHLLDKHPTALFAHTGLEMVDQEDKPLGAVFVGSWAELSKGRDWLKTMLSSFACPVCALTMVRRQAHERYGLYDPTYGFISDVEMWMRLSSVGDVAFAGRPLVRVRTREDGHEATVNPWPVYATTFAIHRRYGGQAVDSFSGLLRHALMPVRADMQVFREVASRLRHRSRLSFGSSVEPLRVGAGPVCRALLPILSRIDSAFAGEVR
jgi:glycosyltransferase involved in cell wall biosynthesis